MLTGWSGRESLGSLSFMGCLPTGKALTERLGAIGVTIHMRGLKGMTPLV